MSRMRMPAVSRNVLRNTTACPVDISRQFTNLAGPTGPGDPAFTREGYLSYSFLSKFANPSPENAAAREERAYEKLLAQDAKNVDTRHRLLGQPAMLRNLSTYEISRSVRALIKRVLGEFTYDVFRASDFSNGSSTSRTRRNAAAIEKFDGKGDVTLRCYPYFQALLALSPHWKRRVEEAEYEAFWLGAPSPIRIVEGNVCFTVPKDNDIDRACSKEPDINMYFQKAVGNHIRSRLLKFGIDLNDQNRNKYLAREGSITNELATLDLSSASDSVTWALCSELLPSDWFDVVDDLRSPRGYINGQWHEWELMSTMGNGFTFELESLIFWAVSKVAVAHYAPHGVVSVYGDDIIVPSAAAPMVVEFLEYYGFTVNTDKSFVDGPFRESCGGHYYNGLDVTPFYCRAPLDSLMRVIWFLNQLRKWANVGGICDPLYGPIYWSVWEQIPSKYRDLLRGGRDLDSITELVTPHVDGHNLHIDSRVVRYDGSTAYTAWCNGVLRRKTPSEMLLRRVDSSGRLCIEPVITSGSMRQSATVSLRRIRDDRYAWNPAKVVPVFLEEIG